MELADVRAFCKTFYTRFSALNVRPLQLRFFDTQDLVSIALMKQNETGDIEAAVCVDEDAVRILKINSFEKLNTFFTYATPLELYTNLLTILLLCCGVSHIIISLPEALCATLGRKINTWRELVTFICSLSPKEQGKIIVQENHQNAIKFLKTTFYVQDNIFITDGLYRSRTPYKDILELIRAVLDALCAVLKIHGYVIDPFLKSPCCSP